MTRRRRHYADRGGSMMLSRRSPRAIEAPEVEVDPHWVAARISNWGEVTRRGGEKTEAFAMSLAPRR